MVSSEGACAAYYLYGRHLESIHHGAAAQPFGTMDSGPDVLISELNKPHLEPR